MIRRSYDSFTIFRNSMWIKELFLGFVIYHIFHFYIYIYILKKQSNSFITEDFLCLCAEVLLFLSKNADKKRNGGNFMAKEYYLYVRGQKVKVSEDIYKVYWREKEHEKYLEQVDKKNHLLFFSSLKYNFSIISSSSLFNFDIAFFNASIIICVATTFSTSTFLSSRLSSKFPY